MAAIGFIYAWQKLYPVLIFRSVVIASKVKKKWAARCTTEHRQPIKSWGLALKLQLQKKLVSKKHKHYHKLAN